MFPDRTPIAVDMPERLLLLATDDESGRIDTKSGALDLGLAGAMLMELILIGRLALADGKVMVTNAAGTEDPMLDEALATIAASRPRGAKHWITRLASPRLRDDVLARLIDKGILRHEEHRILWVIPANRYPADNGGAPEQDIRDSVRAAVVDGATPPPRTAALIGIVRACFLIGAIFNRDQRMRYADRIDRVAAGEPLDGAIAKAVEDMQAAILGTTAST